MICLGENRTNIAIAAGTWKDDLYKFLFDKRKGGLKVRNGKKVVSSHATYFDKMVGIVHYHYKRRKISAGGRDIIINQLNNFKNNYEKIVLADEKALKGYKKVFEDWKKGKKSYVVNLYRRLMVGLYEAFTQSKDKKLNVSYSHKFFNLLNIRTCPYCNRQYTFTLDEKTSKTAPEYDHFYDKSDFPILAVSFYNLVPSCHTCNHMKGQKKTVTINPYFGKFESKFFLTDGNGNKLTKAEILKNGGGEVELLKPDGIESPIDQANINTFGLKGLYRMHDDFVKEIVDKVAAYDTSVQKALVDAFQGPAYHPHMVYDFVWGKYLEEAENDRKPLSKLTREMLEQMGVKR